MSTKRFLFSVAGGSGHFHPVLPLAGALKETGHDVAFAVSASQKPVAEAAGFTAFVVGGNLASDPEYQRVKADWRAMPPGLDSEMFIYEHLWCGVGPRLRTPQLVAVMQEWRPDLVVRESADYAAAIAAEHLGLPHATVGVLASLTGQAVFERRGAARINAVREAWGLPPVPDLSATYKHLLLCFSPPTFSTRSVEWAGSSPDVVPDTTRCVRPQFFDRSTQYGDDLPAWLPSFAQSGKPLVYATLGTEVNNDPGMYPDLLQTIIAGLCDMPVNVVVTLGRDKDPADFGSQPANVHIERYIPQSQLLPLCDLMVMHGGSGSLLQALDAGVPLVMLPLIADQFFNAQVVQSLKLGQVVQTWQTEQPGQLDMARLTPEIFYEAAVEVLASGGYRENVALLQAEMHEMPGQGYAVGLVERLAAGQEI